MNSVHKSTVLRKILFDTQFVYTVGLSLRLGGGLERIPALLAIATLPVCAKASRRSSWGPSAAADGTGMPRGHPEGLQEGPRRFAGTRHDREIDRLSGILTGELGTYAVSS